MEIKEKIYDLSINKNSLCVVKIIISGTKDLKHQEIILEKINKNIIDLACDPFGNYAITEIVTNWS